MEFNRLILEKLGVIFQKHNLFIVEQRANYLKLESARITIIIAHNPLENSNTLWMGKNTSDSDKVEIDNKTLKLFFDSNLQLSQVSIETFIKNLASFFENEGKPLLEGDMIKLSKLERFDLERSNLYTKELLDRQNLTAADTAWNNKDYKEFIKLIDKISRKSLPLSYELKYKIAKKEQ